MNVSIRRCRPADLQAILAWLKEEEALEIEGNFLCNLSIIERAYHEKELLVCVDGTTGAAVAFQLGGLLQSGILQVKHSHRGRGIGRKLVEHCVKRALGQDQCLLHIQCKPRSSVPFWKKMGFTLAPGDGGQLYAYRMLDKRLALPGIGVSADVVVCFYPEEKKWHPEVAALSEHIPVAEITAEGDILLDRRILFHKTAHPGAWDVLVEIKVNGTVRYLDKAKYGEAQAIGVVRCRNGWYIDRILAGLS